MHLIARDCGNWLLPTLMIGFLLTTCTADARGSAWRHPGNQAFLFQDINSKASPGYRSGRRLLMLRRDGQVESKNTNSVSPASAGRYLPGHDGTEQSLELLSQSASGALNIRRLSQGGRGDIGGGTGRGNNGKGHGHRHTNDPAKGVGNRNTNGPPNAPGKRPANKGSNSGSSSRNSGSNSSRSGSSSGNNPSSRGEGTGSSSSERSSSSFGSRRSTRRTTRSKASVMNTYQWLQRYFSQP